MNSVIFRTMAPLLMVVMVALSLFILLRGHNAPGGGFIAGLIAASALALFAMAFGVGETRRRLRINPISVAGAGVLIAVLSGVASVMAGAPYLTGLWLPVNLLGTPTMFDIGVYLTVAGTLSAVALALEDSGEGH
jgi:multicomponent Na+:H+ antiporter subunit B